MNTSAPSQKSRPKNAIPLAFKLIFISLLVLLLNTAFLTFLSPTLSSFLPNLNFVYIFSFAVSTLLSTGLVIFVLHPLSQFLHSFQDFLDAKNSQVTVVHSHDEVEQFSQDLSKLIDYFHQTVGDSNQKQQRSQYEKIRMEQVLSSLYDGIIALNFHKQIIWANKSAQTISQFPLQSMVGRPVDEIFYLQDSSKKRITSDQYCQDISSSSTVPTHFNDLDLITSTRQSVSVNLACISVQNSIQTDLGYLLIIQDTTQQKMLERAQLDFVSMASHELRTPLTSLHNGLAVFLDEKDNLTDDQKELLDNLWSNTQQLMSLIENLLSVSKVERGALGIAPRSLDWKQVLTEAVDSGKLLAAQKNILLTLDLPEQKIPQVLADKYRINEVLNNLINNAINYTDPGGKITLRAIQDKNMVITSVTDTGHGIPKEAIQHLFNKFFRVSNALDTSSNTKGNGLGLYLSKSIVELHHGKIWVESELGKGTTFYFSLPVSERLKFVTPTSPSQAGHPKSPSHPPIPS